MSVLLIYASFAVWFVALAISAYATYRLYEYGPYNTNLVWDFTRKVTDIATCVALGGAVTLLAYGDGYLNSSYWVIVPFFICGYLSAKIILIFVLRLVASPYLRRYQEERRYTQAVMKAVQKLKEEGLYPPRNLFSDDPAESEKFDRAIDELRAQGKLPPVPKWMLEDN